MDSNETRTAYFISDDLVVFASYPNRESSYPTHTSTPIQVTDCSDDALTDLAWSTPMTRAHAQIIDDLAWKIQRSEWCGSRSDFEARRTADEAWAAEFLADLVKDWE